MYPTLRNRIIFTPKNYFQSFFSLTRSLFLSTYSPVRYDLDACDIQEKYPDLFQVNLNIEVDSRDKPSAKTPPWEGFQTKGLNPKILFSSRDEQQEILSKFGRRHCLNKAQGLGLLLFCYIKMIVFHHIFGSMLLHFFSPIETTKLKSDFIHLKLLHLLVWKLQP